MRKSIDSDSIAKPPRVAVLICAAHDPTGGAGITADCQTARALGAIPLAALTAVTAQDLDNARAVFPLAARLLRAQFEPLRPALGGPKTAVKIGVFGSAANARAVAAIARAAATAHIVWDPVLAAGGGLSFVADPPAALEIFAPLAAVVTPNRAEARALAGRDDDDEAARVILARGAKHVAVTDSETRARVVAHRLYSADGAVFEIKDRRRPGVYHGSGCVFSTALAVFLAQGKSAQEAFAAAHETTARAIANARRLPALGAQRIPQPR